LYQGKPSDRDPRNEYDEQNSADHRGYHGKSRSLGLLKLLVVESKVRFE
jgi:hypothetical protein